MTNKMAVLAVLVSLLLLCGAMGAVWAQGAGFDINWDNQTVGSALEQLQRAFGIQYNLPGDLANKRVTVHRQNVTVAEAIQELAKAAGVRVMTDPNGSFVFQAAQAPAAAQPAWGQQPQNPWAALGATGYGAPPMPQRPGTPWVQPQVPGAAVPGMTTPGMQPGMGMQQPGMQMTPFGGQLNPEDLTLRILELNQMSPELAAMLFGGSAIYDQSGGGGGQGGYGQGGYGRNQGRNQGYDQGYGRNQGYDRGRDRGYNQGGYDQNRSSRSSRSSRW